MTVLGDWPTYLLKSIPPEIRAEIEREAGAGSMAEVIRGILCARFSLDCDPVLMRNRFLPINGTDTMILRLQPELWEKIKRDAKRRSTGKRRVSHREVIIEALEKHYAVT